MRKNWIQGENSIEAGKLAYAIDAPTWIFRTRVDYPLTGLIGASVLCVFVLSLYPWEYKLQSQPLKKTNESMSTLIDMCKLITSVRKKSMKRRGDVIVNCRLYAETQGPLEHNSYWILHLLYAIRSMYRS